MKTQTPEQKAKVDELMRLAAQARSERQKASNNAKTEIEQAMILSTPLNRYIAKYRGLSSEKLNSYKEWLAQGKQVKKGEKAFMFFSTPKKYTQKSNNENNTSENTSKDQNVTKYAFRFCYLFTENQTENITTSV